MEILALVVRHARHIHAAAADNNIPAEAVAGVILWDPVENPYRRRFARLGPGRVHPAALWGKTEARRVEEEGRVPPAPDVVTRFRRLRDPATAIDYAAAIMGRHADVYERVARSQIREDVGVLCTLYQGGRSEKRAAELMRRREDEPSAQPSMGNDMGPWVVSNLDFVRSLIGCNERRHQAPAESDPSADLGKRPRPS